MPYWLKRAADLILERWPEWEVEAQQIAQNKQDHEAGDEHLRLCLCSLLGWLHANHSKLAEPK